MPYQYTSINPNADLPSALNQVNRNFAKLDQEAVTKKFGSGPTQVIIGKAGSFVGTVVGDITNNAVIYGLYKPDKLGTLHISGGIPSELSGQHPVDGHMGHWIAKSGVNVITELGGTWP